MTITSLRRVMSTRYIFLLSGFVFILWSLVTAAVPKSSTLSTLLQVDLDPSTTKVTMTEHTTNVAIASPNDAFMPNSSQTRPHPRVGIAHAHTYLISLVDRQDRREQMEFLRTIQGLTWTVIDAIPGNATLVNRILEWVALHRAESKKAGMSGFHWPEEIDALSVSLGPLKQSGSDTWSETSPSNKANLKSGKPGPSMSSSLPCAIEDNSMPTFTNDTPEWMILSPAKIACWHSHLLAIRRFVESQDSHDSRREDDVAVILEDDIDMEKDISTRLSQVWTFLPAGWDIVFLGHCWSDESYYPPLTKFTDTNVHPANYPKCTHAYALSLSGARRLLQHLRYPPFAYSRALDQAYAWLVRSGRLRGYSIVPSLVVQRKSASSDILPGSGSEWREGLRDGVFGAQT